MGKMISSFLLILVVGSDCSKITQTDP